ncbi:MAG TPA: ABC transporter substrate-binding protein [Acidimicrobiales bacterium]|jgi:NitT/TauT family transport system substrate-binding protein
MHKTLRAIGGSAAALLIGATLLAACSSSTNSSSTTTGGNINSTTNSGPNTPAPKPLATMTNVTLTVPAKVESFATPIVAQMNGEFTKENLNVTIELDPGGAASEPQELAQGSAQVTETGLNAGTLNAISQGVGLRYVGYPYTYQTGDKEGFWVDKTYLNKNGTLNKAKLSTFKITLGTAGVASSSALPVQQWLQKSGVNLSQVTITNLSGAALVTALQNGAVQGAYALSPYYQPLLTDPRFTLVTPTPLATGVYEMSSQFISQQPLVAQAIMRALIRTDRTDLGPNYRNNAAVMGIISTWLGIPAATVANNPAVVFSTDMDTAALGPLLTGVQQMWISLGGVLSYTKPLTVKQVVDPSVVNAVLK